MTHPPVGPAWLVWLETTALADAMRQWLWLYPIVEIVHIAGTVLLVGAAAMFDLRLLGLSRRLPVAELERRRLPSLALPRRERLERGGPTPLAAKGAAVLSLALWLGVISCGRLLAYL